jgi:3-deoxy-manno-octulosonate cytidylyltransferase (CMP-KDO synthetase)
MLMAVSETNWSGAGPDYAVVIPARFGSSRFPGKPLAPIRGASGRTKSLIERSWEAARGAVPANRIWIATDDPRIEEEACGFGAQTVRTPPDCRNGTERCWHAVETAGIDAEVILNLPGDAPLIPPLALDMILDTMIELPWLSVATPMLRCSGALRERLLMEDGIGSSAGTTVVFDQMMNALYFSKRVIPYMPAPDRPRASETEPASTEPCPSPPIYLHIGLYGYRRDALEAYAELEPSSLELIEGLEQLRFVQAGIPVRMIEVCPPPGGLSEVNHPGDIVGVEAALAQRRIP